MNSLGTLEKPFGLLETLALCGVLKLGGAYAAAIVFVGVYGSVAFVLAAGWTWMLADRPGLVRT